MTGVKWAANFLRALSLGCAVAVVSGAAFAAPPETGSDSKSADCLTSPKAATPPGERWYYRVERGTKRHCWYTRAGAAGGVASQRVRPAALPKQAVELPAAVNEPLELTVANARAEASIAPQKPASEQSAPPAAPTQNPAWTMADRWSQDGGEPPPALVKTLSVRVAAPPATAPPIDQQTAPEISVRENADDSLIGMAAAVVALLGLSSVLVAMLMRRRRQRSDKADRAPLTIEPVTDLNDRPLMTWRKNLRDELQRVNSGDAAFSAQTGLNPIDREALPRRRTAPPGVRA